MTAIKGSSRWSRISSYEVRAMSTPDRRYLAHCIRDALGVMAARFALG